jgi:hypothetical protein
MPLLALMAAAAAMHAVDVPKTLGQNRIDAQKTRTGLTVLLPQTIQTEFKKVYANALPAGKDRYGLVIGAAPGCNGAQVCGIATFSAVKGLKPTGGKKVKLAKGRKGRYHKSACGASCSFPSIEWRERGALYHVDYKESTGIKNMKRLANSAIRKGPR